ncbi:MAG: fibronectin type III domain-containing protein [Clostridiales bacterium]|nr:fibronectin type III domain-containing protein [Clostridiales bacterium]
MDLNGDGSAGSPNDYFICQDYQGYSSEQYPDHISLGSRTNHPKNLTVTDVSSDSVSLSWDAVSGADYYSISCGNTYNFTNFTEITLTNLTPDTEYLIGITACADYDYSANPSEISVRTNPIAAPGFEYAIDAVNGKDYTLVLTGKAISDFTGKVFTVTYDPTKLTLTDFAAQTQTLDTTIAAVPETPVTVLSHDTTTGVITFKVNREIAAGQTWSGVLTALKFTAKATGNTVVNFEQ